MFKRIITKKSFWAGIALICTGTVQCIHGNYDTGIQTIFTGVATITLRDAIEKQSI